jgi:hypothetical protein
MRIEDVNVCNPKKDFKVGDVVLCKGGCYRYVVASGSKIIMINLMSSTVTSTHESLNSARRIFYNKIEEIIPANQVSLVINRKGTEHES